MKNRVSLIFAAVMLAVAGVQAAPRQLQTMRVTAQRMLAELPALQAAGDAVPLDKTPNVLMSNEALSVIGYEAQGFVVLSNDDILPEVLAISDGSLNSRNDGFQWWLNAMSEVCGIHVAKGAMPKTATTKPTVLGFPDHVDAIVTARWDQDEPYWNMCPKQGSRRCYTGCVATAIAQVFYTNRYPTNGYGQRTNTSASSVTVNFSQGNYEYDKMIDSYVGSAYTTEQANAVAKLMLHVGVAVDMSYSPDGSGAYSSDATAGMQQYFGLKDCTYKVRSQFSETQWMTMVYNELAGGHAFYYAGDSPSSWGRDAGHAFVCDGYDANGRVHINWGWGGDCDGFFDIALLNPAGTGYSFKSGQEMILSMYDPDAPLQTLETDTLTMSQPGTLRTLLQQRDLTTLGGVRLLGELDEDDLAVLRQLASESDLADFGQTGTSALCSIDLSVATLPADALPAQAFQGAKLLRQVWLPATLSKVGEKAFAGCTLLRKMRCYAFRVPDTGNGCFDGVASGMQAEVIAGSMNAYLSNAQWSKVLASDNVSEFGTAFVAKDAKRLYGVANPVLGYQVYGPRVSGSPKVSCVAKKASDAGTYVITIQPGTVAMTDEVMLVPGTLVVEPAPLTVGVEDAEREEGASNPDFQLTFDGFRNSDTAETAFSVMPVAACEADAQSPVGTYAIEVSGGEARNYVLSYQPGTLTVVAGVTSLAQVTADGRTAAAAHGVVYDMLGRRVSTAGTLPLGIYIVGGRKVVVRQ